ncbi:MAG: ParB/RepB/Spo0J family partition protein, partial [Candidatus Sericytochromatia bacterium]|nr:ParB/RepB/Spo0J family partition protein [Candidatus Sericytochromatia bacterium]
ALIENLQRSDLTPLETALGLKQLGEAFDLTHDELSQRVGMSRSAVTNSLRLLALPAPIQTLLAKGAMAAGHARALLGCPDAAWQLAIAARIEPEGLSVRTVETLVQAGRRSKPAAKAKPVMASPHVNRLRDALGTAVKLRQNGDKGAIEIAFTSTNQRDTLLALLSDRLVRQAP